jgi:hypothetical protein
MLTVIILNDFFSITYGCKFLYPPFAPVDNYTEISW